MWVRTHPHREGKKNKAVKFGKFSSKNAANSEFLKNARIIR